MPKSGNCQDWKPPIDERCSREAPEVPEARYAYYRRCQHFRHNGVQCKAPAMKGEQICHRHAEQADHERRRQEQRRELLSRPGVGFGSFDAIQRTLSELTQSVFAGTIDRKVAGRLIIDILNAIRLQKMLELVAASASRRPLVCDPRWHAVPVGEKQRAARPNSEDEPKSKAKSSYAFAARPRNLFCQGVLKRDILGPREAAAEPIPHRAPPSQAQGRGIRDSVS